ncbi:MAG: hypothetical protein F6K31_09730 [Symploca sp. SIO2G7]|nr:hypothetical protein [Symploca sp. SIO2G7]
MTKVQGWVSPFDAKTLHLFLISVSPRHRVTASPYLRVTASPCLRISASPYTATA